MPMNYREIADDLASRIAAGEFDKDGGKLPSYSKLAEHYKVHVSTITRALSRLHDRNIIYGESGRGVYVRERGQG